MEYDTRFVNHILLKKYEDCEPRIKRIMRIGGEEIPKF